MQKLTNKSAYRWAMGNTLATVLMLIWLSLGVGIIGKDGDPASLMYFGVVVIGIIGALISRLQATAMARTMSAMAIAQVLITAIVLIARLGLPYSGPLEILTLNGFFIALFSGSDWLFQRAARL